MFQDTLIILPRPLRACLLLSLPSVPLVSILNRDGLELGGSSPHEPKLMKSIIKPALSTSFISFEMDSAYLTPGWQRKPGKIILETGRGFSIDRYSQAWTLKGYFMIAQVCSGPRAMVVAARAVEH